MRCVPYHEPEFSGVSECSLGTGHAIHCTWTENKEYTVSYFFTLYATMSYMSGKKVEGDDELYVSLVGK